MKLTKTKEILDALHWAKKLIDNEIMNIRCGTDKNYSSTESARLEVLFYLVSEVNQNLESEENKNEQ